MLTAPEPLGPDHDLAGFSSGVPVLDDWLERRALANQVTGASRTFVVCENGKVVGYYALAASAVSIVQTVGRFRRNMPNPIPVIVLGRLAIAATHQGRGIGRGLFQDAARRVVALADTVGIRGIVVHAISDDAVTFYRHLGFDASPLDPMTLMVTLADLRAAMKLGRTFKSPHPPIAVSGSLEGIHRKARRREGGFELSESRGHRRNQPYQEVVALEHDGAGAVLPGVFEHELERAAGAPLEALLRERGAGDVPAEPFALLGRVSRCARRCGAPLPVNIQRRRLWVPELGRHVTLNVTTSDIRTIDKIGLLAYAKQHGVRLS